MSNNTKLALEAALERIITGKPKRIPPSRKLSVRAVEEEANLGNGSGYYYPEIIEKVKQTLTKLADNNSIEPRPNIERLRNKLKNEARIKKKYKEKNSQLKQTLSLLATEQHYLNDALRKTLAKLDELELENNELREENSKLKSNVIKIIK